MTDRDSATTDADVLIEVEERAIEMARGAGRILGKHFGTKLSVGYKDENETDPVTQVDKECQEYLVDAISHHFPDHGVVGEEDSPQKDSVAPEFVWILDPLDGTKNYLSGFPVYASSIGVLRKGTPVAGAIYVPWPGADEGSVFHARAGAGAFADDERLSVFEADQPDPVRLVTLPGSLGGSIRFDMAARGKTGEVRVTGSIAHELAMTAKGVLQYTVTMNSHLWDIAAGVLLVKEAGGLAMAGTPVRTFLAGPRLTWANSDSLIPAWREGETTMDELRKWAQPMVLGGPEIVRWVTDNLRTHRSLSRRLTHTLRRLNPTR